MAVTARGQGFQARFMLGGIRYVEQFPTRAKAEAYEATARLAAAKGQPMPALGRTSRHVSIRSMEDLLRHCTEQRWQSRKSGQHLAMIAGLYVDWVGPRLSPAAGLTPHQGDAYAIFRETEKRNATATINRHLPAISASMKHAHRVGLIERTF